MTTTASANLTATEPVLLRDDEDGIATLTLNRPKQYNALSGALLGELQNAFDAIAADQSIRVVVLAAAGPAFCSGHDLKEMRANRTRSFVEDLFRRCCRMMIGMTRIPQPVIARVHGLATAAGCQLVATCDLAVASDNATFATSGVNVGLFCATPGVALSRNVSRKRAMEMLLTGDFIDAPAALEQGLINRVVAPDKLDAAVGELAQAIRKKSPVAIAAGKRLFYDQIDMDIDNAYRLASEVISENMMKDDAAEGIDAFMQKRAPKWRGS